ncbi:MAG: vWA domain-containing protein [Akkermansiaceae bacterium]
MSLHAQLSPEARDKLRKQQRNSTISSIIISLLSILLVGVILLYWFLPTIENITPDIVSYQAGAEEKNKHEKKKISRSVDRKPSAPSSAMAKVIAANTTSTVSIPVPEDNDPMPSVDLGNGDDFGDGWGDGDGWGGGSGTTFFGTKLTGERILYVIDYSGSMSGIKDKLMRKELADSVYKLPHDKKYQMIFFAGPAWVAGNSVKMEGKQSAVISGKGGHKFKWISGGGAHNWKPEGKTQTPEWIDATDKEIKASKKIINTDRLVWGTVWDNPLEMAFRMDPLPNVIIFMTDGSTGNEAMRVADEYSKLAKRKGVIINTISLMEPRAAEAMEKLAKGSGGKFSLVDENGKKTQGKQAAKKKKGKGKKKK